MDEGTRLLNGGGGVEGVGATGQVAGAEMRPTTARAHHHAYLSRPATVREERAR